MKKLFTTSPALQLFLLLFILFVALLLTVTVSVALAPIFGFSLSEAQAGTSIRNLALTRYLMAVQSIGGFMLPPALAAFLICRKRACIFLGVARRPMAQSAALTALALVIAIPFISFSASVNAQLPLPEWATRTDREATELSVALIFTPSVPVMLLNMLVMALIPAVSEELLFRGYLQRLLCSWTKKPHFAIFISAVIFSAIHFQFEGFIPRFLLGALFGYLFYWSGSLWLSVIAHFTNNAATVIAYFYAARQGVDVESAEVETTVSALLALASVFVATNLIARIQQHEKFRRKRHLHPA
ncbi:MAG: CPBP family intramembrane metalloprotease [Prevotellaceae bacterium]|jgi:membrane protease YdiL (CAAX protease family)|nr:CPBP family intramembrane metalloprotease [Prevotellaceae bacterium]